MTKIYCFCAPHSVVIQELCCQRFLKSISAWVLPDDSGEIVVAQPFVESARTKMLEMASAGVVVLPGPHSVAPLTAAQMKMFSSLNLPAGSTVQDLYETVAAQSLMPQFSPDT